MLNLSLLLAFCIAAFWAVAVEAGVVALSASAIRSACLYLATKRPPVFRPLPHPPLEGPPSPVLAPGAS
ncbi:MAG: hypothetical protein ACLQU3_34160 [Limisphaerales bacterium]